MRFRVQNIHKGYCEVWANERDGGRYEYVACVTCRDNGSWRWCSTDYSPFPWDNTIHPTRRECIVNFKRTALIRQMEHAIERQPKESQHWHSPRRDALHDVEWHRHLFAMHGEFEAIKKRLETFEEDR